LRNACTLRALISGGSGSVQPIICNRAGLTKAKKVTITATGLPGKPNITAAFGRPGAAIRPTAMGRPGRMATRQNTTSPSWRIMALV